MIQEVGVVQGIEGEYALVQTERTGACDHCSSKEMCGMGEGGDYAVVRALNTAGAKDGDTVKIEVPEKSFLKATFLVYMVPVISLVAGGIIGGALHPYIGESMTKDSLSALTALIFLVLSIFFVKSVSRKIDKDTRYIPKVVQIIG